MYPQFYHVTSWTKTEKSQPCAQTFRHLGNLQFLAFPPSFLDSGRLNSSVIESSFILEERNPRTSTPKIEKYIETKDIIRSSSDNFKSGKQGKNNTQAHSGQLREQIVSAAVKNQREEGEREARYLNDNVENELLKFVQIMPRPELKRLPSSPLLSSLFASAAVASVFCISFPLFPVRCT